MGPPFPARRGVRVPTAPRYVLGTPGQQGSGNPQQISANFSFPHPFFKGLWETHCGFADGSEVFSSPAVVTPGEGEPRGPGQHHAGKLGTPRHCPSPRLCSKNPSGDFEQPSTSKPESSPGIPTCPNQLLVAAQGDGCISGRISSPPPVPSRRGRAAQHTRPCPASSSLARGFIGHEQFPGAPRQPGAPPASLPQTRPRWAAAQSQPRPVTGCVLVALI